MAADFLLAIETSSLRGSVALGVSADMLAWRALSPERRHTTELLPAIADLLEQAQCGPAEVGVVAFSQGPGSFTGLRVAATVARMWQSAVGCRIVAVPTLEVIARNALAGRPEGAESRCSNCANRVAVIIDARRGQVFGAVFERAEGGEMRTVQDAGVRDPATWLATIDKPCAVLGEGVSRQRDAVVAAGLEILPDELWWPDARQVLAVGRRLAAAGEFCTPEQIVPAYLRPPECEEVYEQRRAEARERRGE